VPSFAAHQGGRSSINREGTPPSSSSASTTSGHSSRAVDLINNGGFEQPVVSPQLLELSAPAVFGPWHVSEGTLLVTPRDP
jgi:hypothetical protein